MTINMLSGRRLVAPYGVAGGQPGSTGRNRVIRASGEVQELPGNVQVEVTPGDIFEIETPGGGGYGPPPP